MTRKVFHPAQRARAPWSVLALLALAGAAIVLAGLGAYFAFAPKPPAIAEPPRIELGSVDRAVAKAIEEACATVRASLKSADAWGRLGMILTAHEMAQDAADLCYRRAAQLNPEDVRWPYHRGIALSKGSP